MYVKINICYTELCLIFLLNSDITVISIAHICIFDREINLWDLQINSSNINYNPSNICTLSGIIILPKLF